MESIAIASPLETFLQQPNIKTSTWLKVIGSITV